MAGAVAEAGAAEEAAEGLNAALSAHPSTIYTRSMSIRSATLDMQSLLPSPLGC
jgi:hypothetical protein